MRRTMRRRGRGGRGGPGGRRDGPGRRVSRSHGRIGPTDRSGGRGRRRCGGDGGRRVRRGRHARQQVPRGSKRLRRSGWRGPPPRGRFPCRPAPLEEGGRSHRFGGKGAISRRAGGPSPGPRSVRPFPEDAARRGIRGAYRASVDPAEGGSPPRGALGGPGAGGSLPPIPRELSSPPRSTPAWTRPSPLGRPSIWAGRTRGGPLSSKPWASGGSRGPAPDSRASPGPSSSSRSVALRGTRSGAGW